VSPATDDLIAYRLARADECLADADLLLEAGSLHSCVNRLYYACFYVVSSLLLRHGFASSKHSGVLAAFNQRFVKSGLVSEADGQLYGMLFRNRGRGDYEDLVAFDAGEVTAWAGGAKQFVAHLKALIDSS